MDVQRYVVRNDALNKENESSLKKWNSDELAGTDNNPSNEFECNICLDFVQDPVITLCGHLFCWPCIYKWIHLQNNISVSPEYPDHQAQCPVCKAEVSSDTLVPLYGRGQITKPSNGKAPQLGIVVPRRPSGPCWDMLSPTATPTPRTNMFSPSGSQPASPMVNPVNGMFGEMVYSRLFGNNSMTNLYSYPNSGHLPGTVSPRVRLHEMQADKSLSRICFFLFCCIFFCLVLF